MRKVLILVACILLFASCATTKAGYNLSKIQNNIQDYSYVGENLRLYETYIYHDFGNYKVKGCDLGTVYIPKYYNLSLSEQQKYILAPQKALIYSNDYYTRIERDNLSYYRRWIQNFHFSFQELKDDKLILRFYVTIKVNSKNNYKDVRLISSNSSISIPADENYGYATFEITKENISEIEKLFLDDNVYFCVDNIRTKFTEDECYFIKTYLNLFHEYSDLRKEFYNMLVQEFGQKDADSMLNNRLRIGMSKKAVKYMLGEPNRTNTSHGTWGTHEQMVYEKNYDKYIYIDNGVVSSWQN